MHPISFIRIAWVRKEIGEAKNEFWMRFHLKSIMVERFWSNKIRVERRPRDFRTLIEQTKLFSNEVSHNVMQTSLNTRWEILNQWLSKSSKYKLTDLALNCFTCYMIYVLIWACFHLWYGTLNIWICLWIWNCVAMWFTCV
jgi:hypothetical protein